MNGYHYILTRQIEWANNRGITLIGSKGVRGYPSCVRQLDQNLFEPLLPEVREAFGRGDGDELGSPGSLGKMQAVHSSSALGVNVFQYWRALSEVPVIAAACGLCRAGSSASRELRFEDKYPLNDDLDFPPNIDVVIYNGSDAKIQRLAIEQVLRGLQSLQARPSVLTPAKELPRRRQLIVINCIRGWGVRLCGRPVTQGLTELFDGLFYTRSIENGKYNVADCLSTER